MDSLPLVFSSGWASGVNAYLVVLVLGIADRVNPTAVPTYIDPWLRRHDVVWAAAGHPAAVFSTSYDELVAMTGAVEVQVD